MFPPKDKSRIREQAFQPVALSGLSFPTNDSPSEQAMRIVTNAAGKVNLVRGIFHHACGFL